MLYHGDIRTFRNKGKRTSINLELPVWSALEAIAQDQKCRGWQSLARRLAAEYEALISEGVTFASILRSYVIHHLVTGSTLPPTLSPEHDAPSPTAPLPKTPAPSSITRVMPLQCTVHYLTLDGVKLKVSPNGNAQI